MINEALGPGIPKPNTQKGDKRILMTSYIASNLQHAQPSSRASGPARIRPGDQWSCKRSPETRDIYQ